MALDPCKITFKEMDLAAQAERAAKAKADAKKHGFRFIRAGEVQVRAPEWLVRGLIEHNNFGVFFGMFGTMKSFAALDLVFCAGTGTPFLGREVRQGTALYIAGEGFGGLARRRAAWEKARGVSLAEAPVYFSSSAAALCEAELFAQVVEAARDVAKEAGPPVLIVVDTWSRNLAGDENSTNDAGTGVHALDTLRREYGSTVIVVHHAGWGDQSRTRGSNALESAADFSYRFEKSAEGIATVYNTKMKDGPQPSPFAFKLEDVPLGILDDEGEELSSAVIVEAVPAGVTKQKAPQGKNQVAALQVLRDCLLRNQENLRSSGFDPENARVPLDQWASALAAPHPDGKPGLDRRRIYGKDGVIEALRSRGLIVIDSGNYVSLAGSAAPEFAGYIYPADNSGGNGTDHPDNSGQFRRKSGTKPAGDEIPF